MNVETKKLDFVDKINLPLPVLKTIILEYDRSKSARHFFYESKLYNTTVRVCNGHHKPISKIFNFESLL